MAVRTNVRRRIRRSAAATGLRTTAVAVLTAAALVSCSQGRTDGGLGADPSAQSATASPSADPEENADQAEQAAAAGTEEPTAPALGRVTRELTELDESMRADGKGPGHFKKPLADMKVLFDTLGEDRSTSNLEKHFSEIVGTRDGINTWMQDHPDDYS
ncbi:hypothetical protein JHN49_26095 [Streptomyces sp. MBT57]|nr:hypothetical protein [Streptomyces sp. MBT57]